MAPDGRRAWSHPAGGEVVAIAWAPDGFRIAYVVHTGHAFVLHVIYGNGIHDATIDRSVRAVRPSWRADSLAFAYVGGGGKAVVYDVAHLSRRVVATPAPVTRLAFAPTGGALALATPSSVVVGASTVVSGEIEALGWLGRRLAVSTSRSAADHIEVFAPNGALRQSYAARGLVEAITPKLVVVRIGPKVIAGNTTLLTVPHNAHVRDLELG